MDDIDLLKLQTLLSLNKQPYGRDPDIGLTRLSFSVDDYVVSYSWWHQKEMTADLGKFALKQLSLRAKLAILLGTIADGSYKSPHTSIAFVANLQWLILIFKEKDPKNNSVLPMLELCLWLGQSIISPETNYRLMELMDDGFLVNNGQDTTKLQLNWFGDAFRLQLQALFDVLQSMALIPEIELREPVYVDLIQYYTTEIRSITRHSSTDDPSWISDILEKFRKESESKSGSLPWKKILSLKQDFFMLHQHYMNERTRSTNWYCGLQVNYIKHGPPHPDLTGTVICKNSTLVGRLCRQLDYKGFCIQYTA